MSEVIANPTFPSPSPTPNTDTQVFWEATKKGELLFTRCLDCHEAVWYPRPICPFCHSTNTAWEQASGRGHIYSFSIIRKGVGPYAEAGPYCLAYVQLEEGPRMMTNVVDVAVEDIAVDQAVEVVFHATANEFALPRFRPL